GLLTESKGWGFNSRFSHLHEAYAMQIYISNTRLSCHCCLSFIVLVCLSQSRKGVIAFARESLLCVLQHILLCSLSPSGPGAIHFLGNIP
ncbi:unnamed protein product, partial [Bubo scandiacus]